MNWKFRAVSSALVVCLAAVLGIVSPSSAAKSDHDPKMIDIDTPLFVGYDKAVKAYHFRVNGHWLAQCGGEFCWGEYYPGGNNHDLGSDDAVGIRFSDSVQFKKFRLRTYDSCGHATSDRTKSYTSGSFEDGFAAVDDKVLQGWTYSIANGSVVTDAGNCKSPAMPKWKMCGGPGCITIWGDLKAAAFSYDVWVNPAPSRGRCYDRLYVKGRYTHTWTSSGLAYSVGYPWGVGVCPVSGSGHFTTYQDQDGLADLDLTTPKLCRH